MENSVTTRETRLKLGSGLLGRCVAGVSTFTLGITVAAMAMAQQQNIYMESEKARFQAAPKAPGAESGDAAAGSVEMILGVPVNTIFFIAVAVIAVLWFTLGGGRKAKVTGQHT